MSKLKTRNFNLPDKKGERSTKVFAKAGLDNVASAMCYYQQRLRLEVHYSALVHIFNISFSIGHLYWAGQSMNSPPSAIPVRYGQLEPNSH